MKIIATAIAVLLLSTAGASPVLAVDNSITPICRADAAGNTYQRPGGFCEAVASNKSMVDSVSTPACPVGYIEVNDNCVPI